VKVSVGASAVGERKNQKKNEIIAEPEELYFTHMGRKQPLVLSGQNFALREISWT